MSIVLQGSTSGSVTLQEPAVAGTTVLDLPAVSGTILTTGSSGQSIPKAALPTGSVLQVVQGTSTTQNSTSSSTFTNSSLSATITPNFSSSKILAIVTTTGRVTDTNNASYYTIYRSSTNLGGSEGLQIVYVNSGNLWATVSMVYLDSPSTTSATTYYGSFRSGGGTSYFGWGSNTPQTIVLMEIAA